MAYNGAVIILIHLLDEYERKQRNRDLNRRLRDASDPFDLPVENFRKLYRLNKHACRDLLLEIEPHMRLIQRVNAVPNVIKMFTALHFFAHGSYQKSVGKDYHLALSQSSVSRCINEISSVIDEHLTQRYIKFPTTFQEMARIKQGFFQKYNFSGVVGTIDCTHISIVPPPSQHPEYPAYLFINRKNFHSINCQLICDSDLKILGVNARYPGSVHDAAIWMMCSVRRFLENNFMDGDRTTWLLGDSGYPLQPFVLTPIVHADPNTPEGRYTRRHGRARNTIERCNGVLKAYFRCLHKNRTLHYQPPTAAKIINSCTVLHNIFVERRLHDLNLEIDAIDENDDDEANGIHLLNNDLLEEGRIIRNQYIRNHCQ